MRYKPQQNAQNAGCGQCLWLQVPVKCSCGLEHGQPAQRTMSKVIFDGFRWFFDPFCSQSSQNGVPIVQLMFLYEARARARALRTGTSSVQLGPHFWPLSVKLERSGSSKPKETSQVTRAGWARGAAARPAHAAGPEFYMLQHSICWSWNVSKAVNHSNSSICWSRNSSQAVTYSIC